MECFQLCYLDVAGDDDVEPWLPELKLALAMLFGAVGVLYYLEFLGKLLSSNGIAVSK